jgi:hypothetical protein
MGRQMLAVALLGTVASWGCAGSPSAPTPVEILSQQYRLTCGPGWSPSTPPAVRTLIDIRVKGADQITQADRDSLRRNGADIVHEFAAAGGQLRVAMDVARVLPLFRQTPFSSGDFISSAVTVTDPASFKVIMIVTLDHPVTDADLDSARALGGTIRNVYTSALAGYSLEIEDAMVARLRSLPGVVRANLSSYVCLV